MIALLIKEPIGYALYLNDKALKRIKQGYSYPEREREILYSFCVSNLELALKLLPGRVKERG